MHSIEYFGRLNVALLFYLLINLNASFLCAITVEELSNYNEQELTEWLIHDNSALEFLSAPELELPTDTQSFLRYKLIEQNYVTLIEFFEIIQAYSADGKYALCTMGLSLGCTGYGTVTLWNLGETYTSQTLKGHSGRISLAAFSPDGRYILAASYPNQLILWDLTSDCPACTILSTTEPSITCIAFNESEQALIGTKNQVILWDLESRELVDCISLLGESEVTAVALYDYCSLFGDTNKKVYYQIDPTEDLENYVFLSKCKHHVDSLEFTKDGSFAIAGGKGEIHKVLQFDGCFTNIDNLSFNDQVNILIKDLVNSKENLRLHHLSHLKEIFRIVAKFRLSYKNKLAKTTGGRTRFKFKGKIDGNLYDAITLNDWLQKNVSEYDYGNVLMRYHIKVNPDGKFTITGYYQEVASLGYQCFSGITLCNIAFALECLKNQV